MFSLIKSYRIYSSLYCARINHQSTNITNQAFNQKKTSIRWMAFDIDKSRFPVLDENDLEEKFIRGGGPGGQKVNKAVNCCFLKHIPTGISVKCHEQRSLEQNRAKAREILLERLDNHHNAENSVQMQKTRIIQQRIALKKANQERMRQLKLAYKVSNTPIDSEVSHDQTNEHQS